MSEPGMTWREWFELLIEGGVSGFWFLEEGLVYTGRRPANAGQAAKVGVQLFILARSLTFLDMELKDPDSPCREFWKMGGWKRDWQDHLQPTNYQLWAMSNPLWMTYMVTGLDSKIFKAAARLYYKMAATCRPKEYPDPLVLDLDGDGIETTGLRDGAFFDYDGNGLATLTGWVARDDGLLVMDRNGDGLVNDASELFGDQSILVSGEKALNAFQALAELDGNGDGRIDVSDKAYSQLRVWRDLDGDGYSSPNELFTLGEVGIEAINLDSTIANETDTQGNTATRTGTFVRADGTTGQMAEYRFQTDNLYTLPNEWLDAGEDIEALPDLHIERGSSLLLTQTGHGDRVIASYSSPDRRRS